MYEKQSMGKHDVWFSTRSVLGGGWALRQVCLGG